MLDFVDLTNECQRNITVLDSECQYVFSVPLHLSKHKYVGLYP